MDVPTIDDVLGEIAADFHGEIVLIEKAQTDGAGGPKRHLRLIAQRAAYEMRFYCVVHARTELRRADTAGGTET